MGTSLLIAMTAKFLTRRKIYQDPGQGLEFESSGSEIMQMVSGMASEAVDCWFDSPEESFSIAVYPGADPAKIFWSKKIFIWPLLASLIGLFQYSVITYAGIFSHKKIQACP